MYSISDHLRTCPDGEQARVGEISQIKRYLLRGSTQRQESLAACE